MDDRKLADLRNSPLVTNYLMRHPHRWRVRAVESIDLTSARWAQRHRTVHVAPLRDLLHTQVRSRHSHARLYLPVETLPQGPLLDFTISVDSKPGFLLPRGAQAEKRVNYFDFLANEAQEELRTLGSRLQIPTRPQSLRQLLMLIAGFSAGGWERAQKQARKKPLEFYLETKGVTRNLRRSAARCISAWDPPAAAIREIVLRHEYKSSRSAAQNPILAAPDFQPSSMAQFRGELERLFRVLVQLSEAGEAGAKAGTECVRVYAESGCYWSALVECIVPLDLPFMIKSTRKETVEFDRLGLRPRLHPTAKQLAPFRDADSNHIVVRVSDPNVEIRGRAVKLLKEDGQNWSNTPTDQRISDELCAFYGSEEDRPKRVLLSVPLRLSRPVSLGNMAIYFLIASALIVLVVLGIYRIGEGLHRLSGADLAVILIPSAVAASLLISKDSSTLSAEVAKRGHIAAAIVLLVLWALSIFAYCNHAIYTESDTPKVSPAAKPAACVSPNAGAHNLLR